MLNSDIDPLEELDLDKDDIGEKTRDNYRFITYNKLDVEILEKYTIKDMIVKEPDTEYSDSFKIKANHFYPEYFTEFMAKRKKKKNLNYFIEDVGKYLWCKWNDNQTPENRNDFLTYCFQLIDGVIFKYQRHKHGLSYEEVFQGAVLKIIAAMDKFDPMRKVGEDEKGKILYARVFTFFTMILNYGVCTITMAHGAEKISNASYEQLSRTLGQTPDTISDAGLIYQDFLIFLDTLLADEDELSDNQLLVFTSLKELLNTPSGMFSVSTNMMNAIREKTALKVKDISDAMSFLKEMFGNLRIMSHKEKFIFPENEY